MVISIGLGILIGVLNGLASYVLVKRAVKESNIRFFTVVLGSMAVRLLLLVLIVLGILLFVPAIQPLPFAASVVFSVLAGILLDTIQINRLVSGEVIQEKSVPE